MSKLYSSSHIQKILEKLGFVFVSQKGSHGKFKKNNGLIVILPMNKKEIPFGTFRSILRQAKIDLNVFKNFD
ncbi:addiction module toxin, HicA family [Candidatus Dependentiae bacterium]|nr:addiction module toxin, HicA family [Candidatus Dependentiae bacterium]